MKAKRTWRGWQGHFICPVWWHLNTLVEYDDTKVVVSTVGQLSRGQFGYREDGNRATCDGDWEGLDGVGSKYETMVFPADDTIYHDAVADFENDPYSGLTRHYHTEDEAQAGHYETLAAVDAILDEKTGEDELREYGSSFPRPPY